jgi:hypothetical protein
MPESGLNSLVKVPSAVVEHLKDEPVLLGGMGAGALIAIIAVFAPAGTQVYGWIVGGLMLVLCLGKLILGAPTSHARAGSQPSQDSPKPQDGSNNIKIGNNSNFRVDRLIADQNNITGGDGVTVEGGTYEARTSRTRPAAGDGETSQH